MLDAVVQRVLDELVLGLLEQVKSEARKYYARAPHALERDELEGIGNSALVWSASNWENYCGRHGYDPAHTHYFRAYALRRIRGAILDHLRDKDWVSRAVRSKYKKLQEVPEARGSGEEVLHRETGLPVQVIRETVAAVARRPVSLDERAEDVPGLEGVESQTVAGGILAAIGNARGLLPVSAQAVVALRFYHGMDMAEIAQRLNITPGEAQELHNSGVLAIHQAMLGQVA